MFSRSECFPAALLLCLTFLEPFIALGKICSDRFDTFEWFEVRLRSTGSRFDYIRHVRSSITFIHLCISRIYISSETFDLPLSIATNHSAVVWNFSRPFEVMATRYLLGKQYRLAIYVWKQRGFTSKWREDKPRFCAQAWSKTLSLPSSKGTFSQPSWRQMYEWGSENW